MASSTSHDNQMMGEIYDGFITYENKWYVYFSCSQASIFGLTWNSNKHGLVNNP